MTLSAHPRVARGGVRRTVGTILPARNGTGHASVRGELRHPEARQVVQSGWGQRRGRWGLEGVCDISSPSPWTSDVGTRTWLQQGVKVGCGRAATPATACPWLPCHTHSECALAAEPVSKNDSQSVTDLLAWLSCFGCWQCLVTDVAPSGTWLLRQEHASANLVVETPWVSFAGHDIAVARCVDHPRSRSRSVCWQGWGESISSCSSAHLLGGQLVLVEEVSDQRAPSFHTLAVM